MSRHPEDSEGSPVPLRVAEGRSGAVVPLFGKRLIAADACDVLTQATARALSGQLLDVAVIGRVVGPGMFYAHSDWPDTAALVAYLRQLAADIESGESVR